MPAARTIQATDPDTVAAMYVAKNIPAFAIIQGTQLIHAAAPEDMQEGAQMLDQWLEWIEKSKSSAIYTLAVYKNVADEGDITNKTPYNGSFNFQFHKSEAVMGYANGGGWINEMRSEMQGYRQDMKELRQRLEEKEEDEEEKGSGAIIGKLLDPEFIAQIPALVGMIKGLLATPPAPPADPYYPDMDEIPPSRKLGAIGAVEGDKVIAESIETLKQHVPDLPEILAKLALVAKKKPATLKAALLIIRGMRV